MPDSNSSCTSLQQIKARDADICWTQQLLYLPATDQISSQMPMPHLTALAPPCNRSNLMCQTIMWMQTWTAEHVADHNECPHQAADERRAALLCLQGCVMATASNVLGLPACTEQHEWQLDSLHEHHGLVYIPSCLWQFCCTVHPMHTNTYAYLGTHVRFERCCHANAHSILCP